MATQSVTISAVYFSAQMKAYPRRIEFDGKSIKLIDGIRCLVSSNDQKFTLFNMTDGQHNYRLKQTGDKWQLIS